MSSDQEFLRALRDSASIDAPRRGAQERLVASLAMTTASAGISAGAGSLFLGSSVKWLLGAAAVAAAASVAIYTAKPAEIRPVAESPPNVPAESVPAPAPPSTAAIIPAANALRAAGACSGLSLEDSAPSVCSKAGQRSFLELRNTCSAETVDVFWVDFQCRESFVGRLAPGEVLRQLTFDTHPWRVRDHATHRLLKEFTAHVVAGASGAHTDAPVALPELVVTEASTAVDAAPETCSRDGNRALLRIRNDRATGVVVFWVDFDCREKLYKRLQPGESATQSTFDAHPWRVRDAASGALLVDFVPDSLDGTDYVTLP